MLVILDIDGTLADSTHRDEFLKARDGRPDWDAFMRPDRVLKDSPYPEAQRVVRKFKDLRYDIVLLTGRNEMLRDVTTRWLLEHFDIDATDTNLLMRPSGNMLPAVEYKAQQMQQLLADYKSRSVTSFLFVDDDPKVYEVYGAEGVVLRAPECWSLLFPVEPKPGEDNV